MNRHIEDEEGLFYNVWPLFERQEKQGQTDILLPSLLPVRFSGVDRIIKPLFTLVEYRQRGSKTMASLFYGLYTREEDGENWKTRFAFLFELKSEAGYKGFEVLSGLFALDRSGIKILYIPFKRNNRDESVRASEK